MDAADGTIPAEVAETAAAAPYRSSRRSQRVRESMAASVDEAAIPVSAGAVAEARAGSRAPLGGTSDGVGADAVMVSALAVPKEAQPALQAPKNPWAAPPEAKEGIASAGGMLKVATVAPVDATEIAAAVAEGVARDRGGKGLGEMARTRVGEAPPWEGLEKGKVLEAWHKCGGDVDELARMLKGTNGAQTGAAA